VEYGLCIAASYYATCGKRGTVHHLSEKSSSLFNTQSIGTPRQFGTNPQKFFSLGGQRKIGLPRFFLGHRLNIHVYYRRSVAERSLAPALYQWPNSLL
jgi:hypothetical protein